MAERLPLIRMQPQTVVDWWAHAGGSTQALRATYPQTRLIDVELPTALSTLRAEPAAAARWSLPRWLRRDARMPSPRASADAVVADDAIGDGVAQLLWSNMMLHAVADPQPLLARWRRVLQVDGFLMLSTLGPDTLRELRALYAQCGFGSCGLAFVDMHDIGDMLVGAGFADPVMDQEALTLHWADPQSLLDELRALGGNADPARHAGLRTPRWQARLLAALRERADAQGRIAMRFEIVYGHAFNPPLRARIEAQTTVGLDEMRAMMRSGGMRRTP